MYTTWAIFGRCWGIGLVPYILIRGGPAERCGAVIYALGWAATVIFQSREGNGPGIWVFLIDILVMIAYVVLSAKTRKIWTLFAAAFALAAVLCHIAGYLGKVNVVTYVTGITLWGGYGLKVALTGGMIALELDRYRQWRLNRKPDRLLQP
ncbi:hypothetical protein ABAC460_09465 [Asticcacaulis sp. AC460]|uniref:hypothetical protein n=1 Tax=Asticcacaulis sp. AC460 TaxID=1282360 RepID=UPI0003C40F74|nr:hypothetical protein [Asticcacaulis sp. AC460]ESQ90373.1 hypothetical protein ABAC460_09465 [Asticcacaulis sp. AC460]